MIMKRVYLFLCVFFSLSLYAQTESAQFAIVKDSIRGSAKLYERMADEGQVKATMPNGSVLFLYQADRDVLPWRKADYYTATGDIESGYVNSNFTEDVRDQELIEVERLSAHGNISFRNDSIRVVVSTSNVAAGDRTIKEGADGRRMVGTKQAMGVVNSFPTRRYQSIVVTVKGRSTTIPRSLFDYLFEPILENTSVFYDPISRMVYISATNGSGSAVYNVLWSVDNRGKSQVYVRSGQLF